jgi:hypothetical protein
MTAPAGVTAGAAAAHTLLIMLIEVSSTDEIPRHFSTFQGKARRFPGACWGMLGCFDQNKGCGKPVSLRCGIVRSVAAACRDRRELTAKT